MIQVSRLNSLATRTVPYALFVLVSVFTASALTQLYLEFQTELKSDKQILERLISPSEAAFIHADHELDPVFSKQLINGFLMNEIVHAARLEAYDGTVLAEGRNEPVAEMMPLVSMLLSEAKVLRSIPLSGQALAADNLKKPTIQHFIFRN